MTVRPRRQDGAGPPELDCARIPVWDPDRQLCWGVLHKKGGTAGSGLTSRRNWTKRVFWVPHRIGTSANFELAYFQGEPKDWHAADVLAHAKGVLSLAGATVLSTSSEHRNRDVGFEFQLHGA